MRHAGVKLLNLVQKYKYLRFPEIGFILHLRSLAPELLTMPGRAIIAKELASVLSALAHPHRIRIIEELGGGECDVNTLQQALGISHSGVSQNLAVLRAHRLVVERREGRRVIYRLAHPDLAGWLLRGLDFLEHEFVQGDQVRGLLDSVRLQWDRAQADAAAAAPDAGNVKGAGG
jgi:DNA-binding transcriptional ArsR family regulator